MRRAVEPAGPAVLVDEAESPLGRLARRRDRDGRALLAPARIAAGERLRRDFTLARMMPTVTSNWSIGRTGGGPPGGPGDLTDRALAARDRVHAALDTVGRGDLADVLLDVCCFLQGLETVESLRHWPARSAKVVLDIALGRLAVHYGLAEEARGRDGPGRTRRWGAADYRPSVGGGTAAGRD
ncbi:DNA replication protein [Siculibacillus lacustris]|uniref:DNA replication protein n=1 Tax=Siculibacillus lacustris TaxID=1549641 RepID=A0A4Q9VXE5_9HYPH|nr:DNA replication protein [Siculibacillus lacustris]